MGSGLQPIHDVKQRRAPNGAHEYLISAVSDHGSALIARSVAQRIGGAGRDRTDDLLLAKQALSQLSYSPNRKAWWAWEDLNFRPHAYQARALTN
jgi:hypothetical protein